MRRVYVVIELADSSDFDPASNDDLDTLAEDDRAFRPHENRMVDLQGSADGRFLMVVRRCNTEETN